MNLTHWGIWVADESMEIGGHWLIGTDGRVFATMSEAVAKAQLDYLETSVSDIEIKEFK